MDMQIESAETDPSALVGDCYYMAAGIQANQKLVCQSTYQSTFLLHIQWMILSIE